MVTITKNDKKMKVSRSAFKGYFENQGWKIVEGGKKPADNKKDEKPVVETEEVVADDTVDDVDEEDWSEVEDEEIEKPLSEMTKAELREKATSLGVKFSDDTTKDQLRELVKAALN